MLAMASLLLLLVVPLIQLPISFPTGLLILTCCGRRRCRCWDTCTTAYTPPRVWDTDTHVLRPSVGLGLDDDAGGVAAGFALALAPALAPPGGAHPPPRSTGPVHHHDMHAHAQLTVASSAVAAVAVAVAAVAVFVVKRFSLAKEVCHQRASQACPTTSTLISTPRVVAGLAGVPFASSSNDAEDGGGGGGGDGSDGDGGNGGGDGEEGD